MSELKAETIVPQGTTITLQMYPKAEADKVIEELKAKNAQLEDDVEKYGKENVRLKRALWMARAYRGRDNSILLPSKFMRNVWDNVERKCLKKAEEYK